MVTGTIMPFWLTVATAVKPPRPSKVCVPTLANGPASAGGATIAPVTVYAKVPDRVALVHPLLTVCAVAILVASAAAAAYAKNLAKVGFMMVSFWCFFWCFWAALSLDR